jgi:RNA polymerase-binding transcription factor DksA
MDKRIKSTNGNDHARATTADILGRGLAPAARVAAKWRGHYDLLVALRADLQRRKNNLVEDARQEPPHSGLHIGDAGTDQYDADFGLSMVSSEQNALYEIDQALRRIHNGTYGLCEVTGKPIEEERLQALPWTQFSAAAAQELEREGHSARTRLAQRGNLTGPVGDNSDDAGDEE